MGAPGERNRALRSLRMVPAFQAGERTCYSRAGTRNRLETSCRRTIAAARAIAAMATATATATTTANSTTARARTAPETLVAMVRLTGNGHGECQGERALAEPLAVELGRHRKKTGSPSTPTRHGPVRRAQEGVDEHLATASQSNCFGSSDSRVCGHLSLHFQFLRFVRDRGTHQFRRQTPILVRSDRSTPHQAKGWGTTRPSRRAPYRQVRRQVGLSCSACTHPSPTISSRP